MTTVVMQCAASKRPGAGCLRTGEGRDVVFVADPATAPVGDGGVYARPDDPAAGPKSWRHLLLEYNERHRLDNPRRLCRAFELYREPVYRKLVSRFGMGNVFILSAGWGLIAADFLTPYYDITFSGSAEHFKRRRRRHEFDDLCMLPPAASAPIVFVGGQDYLPLFVSLTETIKNERIVFYNAEQPPPAPGCVLRRFRCRSPGRKTNWQYECAAALAEGQLDHAGSGLYG